MAKNTKSCPVTMVKARVEYKGAAYEVCPRGGRLVSVKVTPAILKRRSASDTRKAKEAATKARQEAEATMIRIDDAGNYQLGRYGHKRKARKHGRKARR
jgi:hypothetical protein